MRSVGPNCQIPLIPNRPFDVAKQDDPILIGRILGSVDVSLVEHESLSFAPNAFHAIDQDSGEVVRFSPFYAIYDRTYAVYWDKLTPAEFAAQYRPIRDVFHAPPGSRESFLTDRYCLYAVDRRGEIWCGDIDHAPWPLQLAQAEIRTNTMLEHLKMHVPDVPPLLHFAKCMVFANKR